MTEHACQHYAFGIDQEAACPFCEPADAWLPEDQAIPEHGPRKVTITKSYVTRFGGDAVLDERPAPRDPGSTISYTEFPITRRTMDNWLRLAEKGMSLAALRELAKLDREDCYAISNLLYAARHGGIC